MNATRLLELANHLDNGKLAHETFDFNVLNGGPNDEQGCGTSGCAMGEFPACWPGIWVFSTWGRKTDTLYYTVRCMHPEYVGDHADMWWQINAWLGITPDERCLLFEPAFEPFYVGDPDFDDQELNTYLVGQVRVRKLPADATKEQVAAHIRNFVTLKNPYGL